MLISDTNSPALPYLDLGRSLPALARQPAHHAGLAAASRNSREVSWKRLDKISIRDVEVFKAAQAAKHYGKGPQRYSKKTINNQLAVLRKLFNVAVDWKVLTHAPAVQPLKSPKPDVRFLNFTEARALVDAAEGKWGAMIVVALNTGLRLGELLALKWKHVDLSIGQIVVMRPREPAMRTNPWRRFTTLSMAH